MKERKDGQIDRREVICRVMVFSQMCKVHGDSG